MWSRHYEYVAKYATKAAETTGTVDHRIGELSELDKLPLPTHTRRLIEARWDLDDAYPERMLTRWAHMLGFRGHFSTKSRRYSTTLGALRQVRADHRARQERRERGLSEDLDDSEGSTLVLAHWTYAGQGHTPAHLMPSSDSRTRSAVDARFVDASHSDGPKAAPDGRKGP